MIKLEGLENRKTSKHPHLDDQFIRSFTSKGLFIKLSESEFEKLDYDEFDKISKDLKEKLIVLDKDRVEWDDPQVRRIEEYNRYKDMGLFD